MHKLYSMCLFLFITFYMFQAHSAHHQERQIVSIQPLVIVIIQGVTEGTDQNSGECSLGQTIPI
jgi:hypothetical protein